MGAIQNHPGGADQRATVTTSREEKNQKCSPLLKTLQGNTIGDARGGVLSTRSTKAEEPRRMAWRRLT